MNNTPNAYLSAVVPCASGVGTETLTYITSDFSEVYKFKKICAKHNMTYSVRFKRVEYTDQSHVVKPSVSQSLRNNLKNIYKKFTGQ